MRASIPGRTRGPSRSSTRIRYAPPAARAASQESRAVRALPRWSGPVGEGAKRPRIIARGPGRWGVVGASLLISRWPRRAQAQNLWGRRPPPTLPSMSRQAGILLPLFSLRSASDWGVGEIPDLVPWARWCAGAGFSVAQVLPVNEASRGQNSPYAALSAFDRALLERVRAAPAVRWDEVRALKRRALALAFDRFEREEWAHRTAR